MARFREIIEKVLSRSAKVDVHARHVEGPSLPFDPTKKTSNALRSCSPLSVLGREDVSREVKY